MSGGSPGPATPPATGAAAAFFVSVAGSIAFAAAYVVHPLPWLEGCALGAAFGGLAIGLAQWALHVLPQEQVEDKREEPEDAGLPPEARMPRDGFLRNALYTALGALGLASLFPLRALGPRFGEGLYHTKWTRGARLVDVDGVAYRPASVDAGSVVTVFPEGFIGDANSAVLLIRLPPPIARRGDQRLDGCVAFSKICTHAGCPVGVYRQSTQQLLCPCHQSVFDVADGAVPVSGPATRPLPQLPLVVGADGYLRAGGDFAEPVGPGFWNRS